MFSVGREHRECMRRVKRKDKLNSEVEYRLQLDNGILEELGYLEIKWPLITSNVRPKTSTYDLLLGHIDLSHSIPHVYHQPGDTAKQKLGNLDVVCNIRIINGRRI